MDKYINNMWTVVTVRLKNKHKDIWRIPSARILFTFDLVDSPPPFIERDVKGVEDTAISEQGTADQDESGLGLLSVCI